MSDDLDRARARGVTAPDRRGFVVLEASAGTGKTTVLVDRVLSYVESGERRLHEIAVVTFTELAAAELRVRLRGRIDERLGMALAPEIATRLRAALVDLESAAVGTIHSFAADLLRQRPAESGVDPGFAVADELGERLLFAEAWEEFLRAVESPDDPGLQAAADLGLYAEPALRDAAWAVFRAVRQGQTFEAPRTPFNLAAHAEMIAALEAAQARAQPGGTLAGSIAALLPEMRAIAGLPDREAARRWLQSPPKMRRNVGRSRVEGEAKRLWETAIQSRTALIGAVAHDRLMSLAAWLQPLAGRYQRIAAEHGRVDFDDLILKALRLLRENAEACRHFRRQYPVVMVDEFQDTDAVQTELLLRLGGVIDGHPSSDVEESRGFFVVGDPKQSIYRFRGADVENYRRVRGLPGARTLRLERTFRPVPELVAWVNQVMAAVMAPAALVPEPDAIEYQPLAVDSAARFEAAPRGVVYLKLEPPAQSRVAALRAREAPALARWVRWFVEGGAGATVRDVSGEPRPPRYGDIALLLPALTAFEYFDDALTAEDVPFRLEMGRHFYRRDEIHTLGQVLRLFADPGDSVATVAVLRGPGFGCSEEELAAYALLEPAPRFDLRSFASADRLRSSPRPGAAAVVAVALDRLRDLRAEVLPLSLPEMIGAIVERLGLIPCFAVQTHGEQGVGNLRKAVDVARRLEAQGADSLPRMARAFADLYDLEIPAADAVVHESAGDALRVLTIHSAKGLEFPVVLLGDYAGQPGGPSERLKVRRGGLRLGRDEERVETLGFADIDAEEERREENERKRQLYVAVTRARDLLVLPYLDPATPDRLRVKPGSVFRHLYEPGRGRALPSELGALRAQVLEIDASSLPVRSSRLTPRLSIDDVAAVAPDPAAAERREAELRSTRTAFERCGRLIRPSAVEPEEHVEQVLRTWGQPAAPARARRERARALGDLAHALVAEALGRRAYAAERESAALDLRAAAEVLARTFLDSPLAERARRAGGSLRVEMPLSLDGASGLLDGRLDLAFLEDAGWIVVDLKSDRIDTTEVGARARRYGPQTALYAAALERVTGRPAAEVHLYFMSPGVDWCLADASWEAARRQAAALLG